MKLVKPARCEHVFQPGELTISSFDGQQCSERRMLHRCEECGQLVCLIMHWGDHIKKHERQSGNAN